MIGRTRDLISRRRGVLTLVAVAVALLAGAWIGTAIDSGPQDLSDQLNDARAQLASAETEQDRTLHALKRAKLELADARAALNGAKRKLASAKSQPRKPSSGTKPHHGQGSPAPAPAPQPPEPANPAPSADAQVFTGNGPKDLGLITVGQQSVLSWSSTGSRFEIAVGGATFLDSRDHRGTRDVPGGIYPDVSVTTNGSWKVVITPS